MFDDLKTLSIN